MQPILTENKITKGCRDLRQALFFKLNRYSAFHPTTGRLLSLPVAIVDITLETMDSPIPSILAAAAGAFCLIVGMFPPSAQEIKRGMTYIEASMLLAAHFPIKLALAPFKIFYQTVVIAKNPQKASFFDYSKSAEEPSLNFTLHSLRTAAAHP